MKKTYKLKHLAISFLCGSIFFSGLSFAATKNVEVSLDKLKFLVNGQNKTASDGMYDNNGSKVPASLIYQGTTYIPVRMISSLLGSPVDWNSECKAVIVGTKPTDEALKTACQQPGDKLMDTKFLYLDAATLNSNLKKYNNGDQLITDSVDQLKEIADKEMQSGPYSVTYKTSMPKSGDKHDYVSIGIYWWPDPDKPDGKPYIRKDGFVNPEVKNATFDKESFVKVNSAIRSLSLAYFYTSNEAYADYASKLLKTWYLNPDTKMNPNLNFGQSVPGVNDGRPEGIIESINIMNILDYTMLLNTSKSFNDNDMKQFKGWIADYMKWLMESEIGLGEKKAKNNHGTWYDTQVAAYAVFSGHTDLAKQVLEDSKARVAPQIQPDGTMPLEMERTRSLHYPLYNLQGFVNLAMLGDQVGIDLWNFQTEDGRSMRKSLDFLTPYISGDKKWDLAQAIEENNSEAIPILAQAFAKYKDRTYQDALQKLMSNKKVSRETLLYGAASN